MNTNPTDALIAVTFRCNARCQMCSIWQEKVHHDLPPERYELLPTSLKHINLSGGEPFQRPDFEDIALRIAAKIPHAHYVISTNGFRPDQIVPAVERLHRRIRRLGVRISIDGTAELHDRIRGVAGVFEKCMETAKGLQKIGLRDLGLAFTATDGNLEGLLPTYALTRKLGIQYSVAAAQNSSFFFMNEGEDFLTRKAEFGRMIERLIGAELRGWHPKRWYRAYFEARLSHFVLGEETFGGCVAGRKSFYLAPNGDLFPCNLLEQPMGNLREQTFKQIWQSDRAQSVRQIVDRCPNPCWMICSSASWIRRKPIQPIGWIVENKVRSHMRLAATRATPQTLRKIPASLGE